MKTHKIIAVEVRRNTFDTKGNLTDSEVVEKFTFPTDKEKEALTKFNELNYPTQANISGEHSIIETNEYNKEIKLYEADLDEDGNYDEYELWGNPIKSLS